MAVNWTLPFESKIDCKGPFPRITPEQYLKAHGKTLDEGTEFWEHEASELAWHKPWDVALDDTNPPFYKWFVGGELNPSELCVDRHAKGPRGSIPAILWEGEAIDKGSPPTRRITYSELYAEVNRTALMLRDQYGIGKGDTVGFYMPMVPEFPISMLAVSRLGARFTVVFSGFSSESLSERLADVRARLLVTADAGWRRGSVVPLKEIADRALERTRSVESVVVLRRVGKEVAMRQGRDEYYDSAISRVPEDAHVEPVMVKSEDPFFILHTSGTTGKPKGQVHDTGGYLTLLHATMNWVFDLKPTDTFWCTADIGWVTGHSYVVFGPLLEGGTTLMYEGALDFPQPDRWASIIERHKVTVLYTSPTAIRSFIKNGEEWVARHDTSSVRLMHSVGEPINPEAFNWMFRVVGREAVPFGSTWWMTETGGILVSILPGRGLVPMKAGSNGFAIPGVDAAVFRDDGDEAPDLERGQLVIRRPWPGMPLTIHGDPARYREVYWSKFPGVFYAGDYAVRDRDGYLWVLGRADEVIKVAGHRLGTYELESALVQHPGVAEAAVVGIPDEVRGEIPVGFVILKAGVGPSDRLKRELIETVRDRVGHIATLGDVFFVSKLPKTRSAKIMRRVVRSVLAGGQTGDVSTLEDEASVEEVRKAYSELKEELSRGKLEK